jgi:hypothetical protein
MILYTNYYINYLGLNIEVTLFIVKTLVEDLKNKTKTEYTNHDVSIAI